MLIAGIAVGMSASDNEVRKNELEMKIQLSEKTTDDYTIAISLSAVSTCMSSIALWENTNNYLICREILNDQYSKLVEMLQNAIASGTLQAHPDDAPDLAAMFIRHVNTPGIEQIQNAVDPKLLAPVEFASKLANHVFRNIALAKVAAVAAGMATLYCGTKAYQAWDESCKAKQELEELNATA